MLDGCRALMLAVLRRGLLDAAGDVSDTVARERLVAERSARQWLESPRRGVFCFESICQELDLDPGTLRLYVVRLRRRRSLPRAA